MENNNTAITEAGFSPMVTDTPFSMDFSEGSGQSMFHCLPCETEQEKVKLFNYLNSPDEKSEKVINTELTMVGFAVEPVQLTDDDTGEITIAPRIIILDSKGKTVQFVSVGMVGALQKLVKSFGIEQVKKGITIKVKQVATKRGSMLTFDVIKVVK